MIKLLHFLLAAIALMSIHCHQALAERKPDKPKDATHIVSGTVARVFHRKTKEQNQYIAQIRVETVERGDDLMQGDSLLVYCFQRKADAPRKPAEGGHTAIPKEGQRIRALAKWRHGVLEGLYPNWFTPVTESDVEVRQDPSKALPKVEMFLLERKPIEGVTRPEGLQWSESGSGPLTYVRKEPIFVLSKEKVAKCTVRGVRADVHGLKTNWKVVVELTKEADADLVRRFKALQPKVTKWWTISLNGKLRGESTFHQSWKTFPEIGVAVFQDRDEAERLRQLYSH